MIAFAVAAALHAGFQLSVTVLVYPALVEAPREQWNVAHARHTRRIAPLVAVVYVVLLAAAASYVVEGPGLLGWAALASSAGALAVTALAAGPLHGRLRAETDDLRRRLVVLDRVRCGLAVAGAVAAAVLAVR